jgi:predicted Zn-ribbon and HTH transcriptional regulator
MLLLGALLLAVTVPYGNTDGAGVGGLTFVLGFFVLVAGLAPTAESTEPGTLEKPAQEEPLKAKAELPPRNSGELRSVTQPVTKEVYRETVIREIVKIRCRNCGTLFEEKLNRCPHCGAPP